MSESFAAVTAASEIVIVVLVPLLVSYRRGCPSPSIGTNTSSNNAINI